LKSTIIISIIFVLLYALYNYQNKSKKVTLNSSSKIKKVNKVYPNTQEGVIAYVERVINNGSNRFNFKGGEMEGGYIPKEKAKDVACYVYELSGRKCLEPYSKDAKLYFSSSCAGCHGNDAKGIHGTYPDLTRNPLLGISR